MRLLAFALVFLFVSGTAAYSQEPPQKPQTQNTQGPPETKEQADKTEKLSSPDSTLFNVIISGKLQVPPAQEGQAKKGEGSWFNEIRSSLFTNVKWTDVFLAIFTGLLVWVGARQIGYFATKERAFVFVKSVIFAGLADPTTNRIIHWRISVQWENAGETPTRYLRLRVNSVRQTTLIDNNQFDFADLPGASSIPLVIGPKAAIESDQVDVTVADMIAIRDETRYLYLWGWAEYDDVFRGTPRHRTEYCYRVFVIGDPTDPGPNRVSFRWSLHNAHNGADDECLSRMKTTSPKHRWKFWFF